MVHALRNTTIHCLFTANDGMNNILPSLRRVETNAASLRLIHHYTFNSCRPPEWITIVNTTDFVPNNIHNMAHSNNIQGDYLALNAFFTGCRSYLVIIKMKNDNQVI